VRAVSFVVRCPVRIALSLDYHIAVGLANPITWSPIGQEASGLVDRDSCTDAQLLAKRSAPSSWSRRSTVRFLEQRAPRHAATYRLPPRHTQQPLCMTMLSFRVADEEAQQTQAWAERLGIDRSELLRDALRDHLVRLSGENDSKTWLEQPLDEGERSLAAIADWGLAEDWSDWAAAAR